MVKNSIYSSTLDKQWTYLTKFKMKANHFNSFLCLPLYPVGQQHKGMWESNLKTDSKLSSL